MKEFDDFFRIKLSNNIENIDDIKNINKDLIEFTHFKILPLDGKETYLGGMLKEYSNLEESFYCVRFYNNKNIVSEQLRTFNWCKYFKLHIKYKIEDLIYLEINDKNNEPN